MSSKGVKLISDYNLKLLFSLPFLVLQLENKGLFLYHL